MAPPNLPLNKAGMLLTVLVLVLCACSCVLVTSQTFLPGNRANGFVIYACLSWGDRATGRNQILLNMFAPFRGGEPLAFQTLVLSDTVCGYLPWLPFLPQSGHLVFPP